MSKFGPFIPLTKGIKFFFVWVNCTAGVSSFFLCLFSSRLKSGSGRDPGIELINI